MKLLRNMMVIISIAAALMTLSGCKKDESQLDKDIKIIEKYLTDHNLQAQQLSSGLHYIIQTQGNGTKPTFNSNVVVNYKGYLTNGTVFDQTASGSPITLNLIQTITGWQQGIPLFNSGGKGILFIPSDLGYGGYANGDIPAHSVLIFEIELIDVFK